MIKKQTKILGLEAKEAVIKTMYFATTFNGDCDITVSNFLSQECRDDGVLNGVNVKVNIERSEEVATLLDEINERVYKIIMLQKEFEGGVKC